MSVTTMEIRRPWDGPVVTESVDVTLTAFIEGQYRPANDSYLNYTHFVIAPLDTDIRDGMVRHPHLSVLEYSMGDEVRIPAGANYGSKYAVVYVERLDRGKKVYLCRDEVNWGTDNAP